MMDSVSIPSPKLSSAYHPCRNYPPMPPGHLAQVTPLGFPTHWSYTAFKRIVWLAFRITWKIQDQLAVGDVDPLTACHGTESKSPLCVSMLRAFQGQQAEDQVGNFVKILLHGSKFKLTITA